jgi:hypothetical protein
VVPVLLAVAAVLLQMGRKALASDAAVLALVDVMLVCVAGVASSPPLPPQDTARAARPITVRLPPDQRRGRDP